MTADRVPHSATILRSITRPAFFVWVGILAYTIFFSWFTIARTHNFNAGWYDLGIMTQTVWRTGHGHGFTFTNPETGPSNVHGWTSPRTAIHADYLLALLAPLSWFGHTAEVLLTLQAAIVALGAYFIWRLTRTLMHSAWLGVWFAWVYLLYPPLQFANVFEFHPVTLAITFYLAAADAIIHRQRMRFWVWAALALISKEQVGLTFGLMAGILWWWRGPRRLAGLALGLAWAWVLLQFLVVIPLSRPDLPGNFSFTKFYASSGDDAGAIATNLSDPRLWWEKLATRTHLHNLVQLSAPLGVVPLLNPLIFVAVPEMLIYWLSESPNQQTLFLHYHALFVPIIFLSAIFSWRFVANWLGHRFQQGRVVVHMTFVALTLVGTFVAVQRYSLWPWSPITRWPLVAWQERLKPEVAHAFSLVPPNASVAITQNIGPQAAERPDVYLLPSGLASAEYVIILNRKYDPNIPTNDKRLAEKTMIELYLDWARSQPTWQEVYHHDRVYVFRRLGPSTKPEPVWPDHLLGQ